MRTSESSSRIMGILNATPDSFSGDGSLNVDALVQRGLSMIEQGADILDIGGESSAPYASPVSAEENTRRTEPVIRALRQRTDIPISIDSFHPQTVKAAVDAGADIINDITGFENPEMLAIAADTGVSIIIMHMKGTPETMQMNPAYGDVVTTIRDYLYDRYQAAVAAGISPERIIVDPGIGFGKALEHNLAIIKNMRHFSIDGCPVLLGASRKSMIGAILDLDVENRLEGSLAAAAAGIVNGADIVRVHDVLETKRFMAVFERIQEAPAQ